MNHVNPIPARTIVGGRYRVVGPLGEDGHGAQCEVEALGEEHRRLALHILPAALVSDESLRARYEREALVGLRTGCDRIVKTFEIGYDRESDIAFSVHEICGGEDLDSWMAHRDFLREGEVMRILRDAGEALAAAHTAGVAHGNLKPRHLFIEADMGDQAPRARLAGFGTATLSRASADDGGPARGSPQWMAPEQIAASAGVEPPADVWALGLLGYRLFTGRSYWREANRNRAAAMSIIREVMLSTLEPASARARADCAEGRLPHWFDSWFARCVDRDVSRRFHDAREVCAALGVEVSAVRAPLAAPPETLSGQATLRLAERSPEFLQVQATVPLARSPLATVLPNAPRPAPPASAGRVTRRRRRLASTTAVLLAAALCAFAWHQAGPRAPAAVPAGKEPVSELPAKELSEHVPPRPPSVHRPDAGAPAPDAMRRDSHGPPRRSPPGGAAPVKKKRDARSPEAEECSDPNQCLRIGLHALETRHEAHDEERAARAFQRACAHGIMEACRHLGELLAAGEGVRRDLGRALKLFEEACDGGDHASCADLMALLRSRCEAGEGASCTALGALYLEGKRVPRSIEVGIDLLRRGCRQGDADGCRLLERLHPQQSPQPLRPSPPLGGGEETSA